MSAENAQAIIDKHAAGEPSAPVQSQPSDNPAKFLRDLTVTQQELEAEKKNTPADKAQKPTERAGDGSESDDSDSYTDEDRTLAKHALKRARLTPAQSKALFASLGTEDATHIGLALAENQEGVDAKLERMTQENDQLRQQLASRSSPADTPAAQGDTPADTVITSAAKALAAELGLEGEDIESKLGAFANAIQAPLVEQLKSAASTDADSGAEMVQELLVESAREELTEMFPQLKSARVFRDVLETMETLKARYADLPAKERTVKAMHAASLVELGDELIADASGADDETRRRRLDKQPPRPNNAKSKSAPAPDKYAKARAVLAKHKVPGYG